MTYDNWKATNPADEWLGPEPDEDEMDFGRQPKPVTVSFSGDAEDVAYWRIALARCAEFKGDTVQRIDERSFVIYPRAVNG